MRLLATWARISPAKASRSSPGLKPGRCTASRVATAPATSVMGSTAARVSTSQRDTGSRARPLGGLVVRSTSTQAENRPWVGRDGGGRRVGRPGCSTSLTWASYRAAPGGDESSSSGPGGGTASRPYVIPPRSRGGPPMAPGSAPDTTLAGRTAVVTGASSGIGRAIAESLGGAGAHVVLGGRTREAMDESVARITAAGGSAEAHVHDVRDVAQARALVDAAVTSTGRLDVMVNNAGVSHPEPIIDGEPRALARHVGDQHPRPPGGIAGRGARHARLWRRGPHREHLVGGLAQSRLRRLRRHQARRELHQRVAAARAVRRPHQGGHDHARRHRHQLRPELRPRPCSSSW